MALAEKLRPLDSFGEQRLSTAAAKSAEPEDHVGSSNGWRAGAKRWVSPSTVCLADQADVDFRFGNNEAGQHRTHRALRQQGLTRPWCVDSARAFDHANLPLDRRLPDPIEASNQLVFM